MHLDLLAFLPVAIVPVLLLTILVAVAVGEAATAVLPPISRKNGTASAARVLHFAEMRSDLVSFVLAVVIAKQCSPIHSIIDRTLVVLS